MSILFEGDTINEEGLVCRLGVDYSLDAVQMRDGKWCVRPTNAVGTHGWFYGRSWTAMFVSAPNASVAVRKAGQYVWGR